MDKPYSVSRLRANLYKVLDRVLETGVRVEVERGGRRLRIVPAEPGRRLANLVPHPDYLRSDPEIARAPGLPASSGRFARMLCIQVLLGRPTVPSLRAGAEALTP